MTHKKFNLIFLAGIFGLYLFYNVITMRPLFPMEYFTGNLVVAQLLCLLCILGIKSVLKIPVFSFPVLFLGVTWLYIFSDFVIYLFDGNIAFKKYIFFSEEYILLGLEVSILAFLSFFIGALVHKKKYEYSQKNNQITFTKNEYYATFTAYWVFALSLLIILGFTLLGGGFSSVLTHGYAGDMEGFSDQRKSGEIGTLFFNALYWFLPWSALVLLSTAKRKKELVISTFLMVLTCGLALLTGDRTVPVILLALSLGIRYIRTPDQLNFRKIFATLLLIVMIISIWAKIRVVPVNAWNSSVFIEAISSTVGLSEDKETYATPFSGLFLSMGTSYQTLAWTLERVPEPDNYRYGIDYLRSFTIAVPFAYKYISKVFPAKPTAWATQTLTPGGWSGMAYLQIAEAYLQFGAFGVVFLYGFLGWAITGLWKKTSVTQSGCFLAFSAIVMMQLLGWVRNDSGGIVRSLLWGWIIVYLLPGVLAKIRFKK